MFRGGKDPREQIWGDAERVGAGSKMRGEMHRRWVTAGMIDESGRERHCRTLNPKKIQREAGETCSSQESRRSGNPSSGRCGQTYKMEGRGRRRVCPVRRPHTYAPARPPPPCADAISCSDPVRARWPEDGKSDRWAAGLGLNGLAAGVNSVQAQQARNAMAQAAWLPLSASTERRSEFGM